MALVDQIKTIYPSLTEVDFLSNGGTIHLQNDSDGKGDYIKSWANSNPQPTEAQLQATGK
jgi:hypothetical protein